MESNENKFNSNQNDTSDKKEKIIDLKQSMQPEKTATMDFDNDDHLDSEIKSTTQDAGKNDRQKDPNRKSISLDQAKEQIRDIESNSDKRFTYDEFEEFASFLLDLIDTGISSGLRWYAQDSSITAYEMPKKKIDSLKKNLTLILVKYQAKFSLEFMFVITLILAYSVPFMKARQMRKEVLSYRAGVENKKARKEERKEEIIQDEKIESAEVIEDDPISKNIEKPRRFNRPMKTSMRPQGKPRK